jgi:hypothetical protein
MNAPDGTRIVERWATQYGILSTYTPEESMPAQAALMAIEELSRAEARVERLRESLAAMVALDHDGSDCEGIYPDCKVCAAIKAARAALAETEGK